MTVKNYRWLFWGLMAFGLLADQVSKYAVFHQLFERSNHEVQLIDGVFCLKTAYQSGASETSWRTPLQSVGNEPKPLVNEGALFGLGHDKDWGNAFFAVISVLAVAGIIIWSTRPAMSRDLLHCAALGLIVAGTLGNLYDRIIFNGVRDFLDFQSKVLGVFFATRHWPTFNIADCCLVTGACLLLLQAVFVKTPATEEQSESTAAAVPEPAEARSA